MSLRRQMIGPVPEETERVAKAAFPKGNIYMKMRDELGTIYADEQFAALYPQRGQPAEAPWRLALITVMQFAEDLTDRQAAEAVRSRIDWKYALGLDLTDPGFHFSVLGDFRARLIGGGAEQVLLGRMLDVFQGRGWLKAGQHQRTDSTHVLGHIRILTRIEMVGETLRQTLNSLATVAPEWLRARVPSEWYEQYAKAFDEYRMPKDESALLVLAERIGQDGQRVLTWLEGETSLTWLAELSAVMTLRQVWAQQYEHQADTIRWRNKNDLPAPAATISTPYDPQVCYTRKRDLTWLGYKVHLTETCDLDAPHLITHVETTTAAASDADVVDLIHADLGRRNLLPCEHVVDTGYATGPNLVSSQQHGVDLLGPVKTDHSWQANTADGLDVTHFQIDWDAHRVECPAGQTSRLWLEHPRRNGDTVIQVRFSPTGCRACPLRPQCTHNVAGPRILTLLPKAQHLALLQARQRQTTEEFKTAYRARAGIEGTLSQAVHVSDLRHTRYRGLPKTHLQHVATAAALNLIRSIAWLLETPFAPTRVSRFAALGA
jgi:transposase